MLSYLKLPLKSLTKIWLHNILVNYCRIIIKFYRNVYQDEYVCLCVYICIYIFSFFFKADTTWYDFQF